MLDPSSLFTVTACRNGLCAPPTQDLTQTSSLKVFKVWLKRVLVVDVLLPHLSLLLSCFIPRSQTDLTHSLLLHPCHFSLFSTLLSCLTRTICTGGSDNTNSTRAPLQHHTDWYSAQLSWISPSICSNQSHSPQRVQQTIRDLSGRGYAIHSRDQNAAFVPLSLMWYIEMLLYFDKVKSTMSALGVCPKMNTYLKRHS